jgi:hypothetical protein
LGAPLFLRYNSPPPWASSWLVRDSSVASDAEDGGRVDCEEESSERLLPSPSFDTEAGAVLRPGVTCEVAISLSIELVIVLGRSGPTIDDLPTPLLLLFSETSVSAEFFMVGHLESLEEIDAIN